MALTFAGALDPERIFATAEAMGGRATGRFFALNAMENRVYEVEMEDDEPSRIVKFYRPGRWDEEAIRAEHDFLRGAAELEIPVALPFADGDGNSLLRGEDGLWAAVFPKVRGRLEPELSIPQLQRLGTYLARLHLYGASIKNAPRLTLDTATYIDSSMAAIDESGTCKGQVWPRWQTVVDEVRRTIAPILADNPSTLLLHGDCHAGNVLWQGDQPVFIDFDDMVYAPPAQDLWMLVPQADPESPRRWAEVLAAYRSIRPLPASALRAVEPLRTLRLVYFSSWIARRWDDPAFKTVFPNFGSDRYWFDQIDALTDIMARIAEGLTVERFAEP